VRDADLKELKRQRGALSDAYGRLADRYDELVGQAAAKK
jgi:hypothetical protein